VTETLSLLLTDEIYVGETGAGLDILIYLRLCGVLAELILKLEGVIEVILDDALAPVGDDKDILDARGNGFLYWIAGLSTIFSISLGTAFEAGRTLVPRPAAGIIAFLTFMDITS
jgi:hypothetical protein